MAPDMVSYNTVLKALHAEGRVRDIAALHIDMRHRHHSLPAAAQLQLLEAAARVEEHDVVLLTWQALVGMRTAVPPAALASVLQTMVAMVHKPLLLALSAVTICF